VRRTLRWRAVWCVLVVAAIVLLIRWLWIGGGIVAAVLLMDWLSGM
jgi:hypothetical protein